MWEGKKLDLLTVFLPSDGILAGIFNINCDRLCGMARIVVVEDEADLRELLIEELADMGHDTTQAVNGEEGLELILRQKPDLILADINMPKLDGRELRKRLVNDHPDHAAIPFCFMSAFADRQDIKEGMSTGADHYFTKPIDYCELEDWIREHIQA